jgi:hypothetical protein
MNIAFAGPLSGALPIQPQTARWAGKSPRSAPGAGAVDQMFARRQ